MKTFSRFLLSAGFALAIASTSSCSGDDGSDGKTPYIGDNGNWFIDGKDTGVNAQGKDGKDGGDGKDGAAGEPGASGDGGKDASPCVMEDFSDTQIKITCGKDAAFVPKFCGSEAYNSGAHFCDTDKGVAYTFVEIGGQTWMAEDLKGAAANKFTWAEATADGLCPAGWKLPSKEDFDALVLEEDFEDSWEGTGSWWSGDEEDTEEAYRLYNKQTSTSGKGTTYAIRCLKD